VTQIDLMPEDLDILRNVLKNGPALRMKVFVFGARATGNPSPGAGLDLAIDAERALTLEEQATIAAALAESGLPYAIRIEDLHAVDEALRAVIEREKAPLLLI